MGHVPDWMRGSMKKTGAAPAKPGIVSRPIFHGESVAMLADGGTAFDYDNPGKVVGNYQSAEELKGYSGNDPIVKARLGMTDSQPKYDSIEQLIDGKVDTAPKEVEVRKVEPARDTTVKPSASKSVRKSSAAPAAPKAKGTSVMHDESDGSYEQLRSKSKPVDKNRPYDTPMDGVVQKVGSWLKSQAAKPVDTSPSDYDKNFRR